MQVDASLVFILGMVLGLCLGIPVGVIVGEAWNGIGNRFAIRFSTWWESRKGGPIVIPAAESRGLVSVEYAARELLCWTAGMGGRVKRSRMQLERALEHATRARKDEPVT